MIVEFKKIKNEKETGNGKLTVSEGRMDVIVDKKRYSCYAHISTGSVISAEITCEKMEEKTLKMVNTLWYLSNFGGVKIGYNNPIDPKIALIGQVDDDVYDSMFPETINWKGKYDIIQQEYDDLRELAENYELELRSLHDKCANILLDHNNISPKVSNTLTYSKKSSNLPF